MSEEEIAVLSVIQKFISGIKSRSPATMHSCVLPDGHALLIRPKAYTGAVEPSTTLPNSEKQPGKQHLRITLAEVINRLPFDSEKNLEENIALASWEEGDDGAGEAYQGRKTEVRVDHDLAMVWAPFEFLIDGERHHVGTNVFSLVNVPPTEEQGEGVWKIAWISDTYRGV